MHMRGVKMNRRLKKCECEVLTLVMTHKWFDMIADGGKREEYRVASAHNTRLLDKFALRLSASGNKPKKQAVVAFMRGYRKPSMWFTTTGQDLAEHLTRKRHPEWGEPDENHGYFVISLGDRIELID